MHADRDPQDERRPATDARPSRSPATTDPHAKGSAHVPQSCAQGARAAPDVASPLVAEAGGAREERRDQRRRGSRPGAEAQQAPTRVHGDRPAHEQQVSVPAERRPRRPQREQRGRDLRQRLVVMEPLTPRERIRSSRRRESPRPGSGPRPAPPSTDGPRRGSEPRLLHFGHKRRSANDQPQQQGRKGERAQSRHRCARPSARREASRRDQVAAVGVRHGRESTSRDRDRGVEPPVGARLGGLPVGRVDPTPGPIVEDTTSEWM